MRWPLVLYPTFNLVVLGLGNTWPPRPGLPPAARCTLRASLNSSNGPRSFSLERKWASSLCTRSETWARFVSEAVMVLTFLPGWLFAFVFNDYLVTYVQRGSSANLLQPKNGRLSRFLRLSTRIPCLHAGHVRCFSRQAGLEHILVSWVSAVSMPSLHL